jgi:hypothetical protein
MESRSIRRWAQSTRDKIMRFLLVAFIACLSGVSGVAQCPIQPRAASLDASRKNFTIRYYNSSMRTAQDVQFVLLNEDAGLSGQRLVQSFSARGILRPKQERAALFPVSGMAFNGTMELEVNKVVFADRSMWSARGDNSCKIEFNGH